MVPLLFYLVMALANLLALAAATRKVRIWVRRKAPDWWPTWHLHLLFWLTVVDVLLYDIVLLLETAD